MGKPFGVPVVFPVREQYDTNRHLDGTVANAAVQLILPANPQRRWATVQCLKTSAGPLIVLLAQKEPSGLSDIHAPIWLEPGDSVIFSRSGDMPWDGPIFGYGAGAIATIYAAEIRDYQ